MDGHEAGVRGRVPVTRHPECARGVRAVAGPSAADVEQQGLPAADDPATRLVVWRGAVRPGGDDGELSRVVALVDEALAHLPGDVGLRAAHEPTGGDGLHDAVGRCSRLAHEDELLGVLGSAQRREQGGRQSPSDAGAQDGLEAQQEGRSQPVGDQDGALHVGRSSRPVGQERGKEHERIVRLLPGDQAHAPLGQPGRLQGCWRLQPRTDEGERPAWRHDQEVEPFVPDGRVTGQPLELRAHPHEQGARARAGHGSLRLRHALDEARRADHPAHVADDGSARPGTDADSQPDTSRGPSLKNFW